MLGSDMVLEQDINLSNIQLTGKYWAADNTKTNCPTGFTIPLIRKSDLDSVRLN